MASILLIAGATISWSFLVRLHTSGIDVTATASDPKGQLDGLIRHPSLVFEVLDNTYHTHLLDYLEQVVGRLGWLDMALPVFIHFAAWASLVLAAMQSTAQAVRQNSLSAKVFVAVFLCMAAGVFLIDMIQYLTFSSVSSAVIEGVQGRYLLEIIMILPVFVYGSEPSKKYEKFVRIVLVLIRSLRIFK